MSKRSINLILPIKPEPPLVKKLRVFLPLFAGVLTVIFLILFSATIIFLKVRNDEYERMLTEYNRLEAIIVSQKEPEGLYLLTYRVLKNIESIIESSTTFHAFVNDVSTFNTSQLILTQFTVDKVGTVKVNIDATSSQSLTELLDILSKADEEKRYYDITASEIGRNSDQRYQVSLTFRSNQKLLK